MACCCILSEPKPVPEAKSPIIALRDIDLNAADALLRTQLGQNESDTLGAVAFPPFAAVTDKHRHLGFLGLREEFHVDVANVPSADLYSIEPISRLLSIPQPIHVAP